LNTNINKIIIVFNPNKRFYGALIVQIPFFSHLKLLYPEHKIIVLSRVKQTNMLKELQLIDEIILYNKSFLYFPLLLLINKIRPTMCINMRKDAELINLMMFLSQSIDNIGFSNSFFSRFTLRRWIKYQGNVYIAQEYLNLLRCINTIPDEDYFWFDSKSINIDNDIETNKLYICFVPGGGADYKRWSIDNFLVLAGLILREYENAHISFILGADEEHYIQIVKSRLRDDQYTLYFNQDIYKLITVFKSSRLIVSNDCGPSHIAQMLNIDYIGIWGYTMRFDTYDLINEWSIKKDNTIHIVPQKGEHINANKPETVFEALKMMLNND